MLSFKQIIITLVILLSFFVGVIFFKDIRSTSAFFDMFCFTQFGERWSLLMKDSDSFNWFVKLFTYPLVFVILFQLLVLVMLTLRKEMEVVYIMMSTNFIMFSALYLFLCVMIS